MDSFKLKTKNGFIGIGNEYPIRVNCNVGTNSQSSYNSEKQKIDRIFEFADTTPDIMMDLSIVKNKSSLSKYIIDNYGIPVGLIPTYLIYNKNKGISEKHLIDYIIEKAEQQISFFTLHLTANIGLYEIALKERKIPTTSRGGAILLSDTIINKRKENIFVNCLDEIISIAIKYNIAISLGATFRPAGIKDACDNVHILETKPQLKFCHYLQERGVNVIIENIGHIDLNDIKTHSKLLAEFKAPIMPLGPLPTDNAIGNDHIASAIGGAFSGFYKSAHILNCISPNEHLTSNITIEDTITAIKTAKITAHCINILNFEEIRNIDNTIYENRAKSKSCFNHQTGKCLRCDDFCPLNILKL